MSSARERNNAIRSSLLSTQSLHSDSIPREINVTNIVAARVDEINQIKNSISTITSMRRIYQQLIRHKRRRAMSHDVKRIPKVMREAGYRELLRAIDGGNAPPFKNPHRNFRRSKKMKLFNHFFRSQKHNWLETHHFHAKRTHMGVRWGYKIPLRTNDKADRAVEKFQAIKTVVCDDSNMNILEIFAKQQYLHVLFPLVSNYYNQLVEELEKGDDERLNQYALDRLNTSVYNVLSSDIINGNVEIPLILRYPTTQSIIHAAKQLFPTLSTQMITEQITTKRLFWIINNIVDDVSVSDKNNQTNLLKNKKNQKSCQSQYSNLIVAPIRLQWVPSSNTTINTTNDTMKSVWCWVHPSSTHLISSLFTSILSFFTHLNTLTVSKSDQIRDCDGIYTINNLSGKFSRLSFRGPKATITLSRIISLLPPTDENMSLLNQLNSLQSSLNTNTNATITASTLQNTQSISLWKKLVGLEQDHNNTNTQTLAVKSLHLNTSAYITPNRTLSLTVLNPHSEQHYNVQTNNGNNIKLPNDTKLFKTQELSRTFKIEHRLCPLGSLDGSLSRSRSKKTISAPTSSAVSGTKVTLHQQAPGLFMSAGGMLQQPNLQQFSSVHNNINTTPPTQNITNLTFIPAQWTPITSTSHPQRYSAPISAVGAVNSDNNNITLNSFLFNPKQLEYLIKFSPGNVAAHNSALKKGLNLEEMVPIEDDTKITTLNTTTTTTTEPNTLTTSTKLTPPAATKPTKPSKLTSFPITNILLIYRSPQTSKYTSETTKSTKTPSELLQYGWDLIVPRGWGRSFFTAAVKSAGAIMLGHEQKTTNQLESSELCDAFPHSATFPNSIAGMVQEHVTRIDNIIEAIRYKRFKYNKITAYGAFGPSYYSLFHPTNQSLSQRQPNTNNENEKIIVNTNIDNDMTSPDGTSGYPYQKISPINLNPVQNLHLFAQIRTWICRLVRYHRALNKKKRRSARNNQGNWLKSLQKKKLKQNIVMKITKHQDNNTIKRSKNTPDSTSERTNPLVSLDNTTMSNDNDKGMGDNDDKGTKMTFTVEIQPKKPHKKAICPIPNLSLFSPSHLPAPPSTSTLPQKISNNSNNDNILGQKNPIKFSHHSQLTTKLPLYSSYIGSSRRSLSLLLRHIGDNVLNKHEKQKVMVLLTSKYSPLYFPPLSWLHKRTYQNQMLLKPIVPVGGNNVTAALAANEKFEYFNFKEHYKKGQFNSFLTRNFNVINNLFYFYPILLNTLHRSDVKYFNNISGNAKNIKKGNKYINENKMSDTGNNGINDVNDQKITQMINNVKLIPRIATLPQSIITLFAQIANQHGLEWLQQRLWLVDVVILYCVLANTHGNSNDKKEGEDQKKNQKNKSCNSNSIVPIRFEQLSAGLLSSNSVVTSPTIDELTVLYHHQTIKHGKSVNNQSVVRNDDDNSNNNSHKTTNNIKIPSDQPVGFVVHTHNSLKLGKPHGLGFITIDSLIDQLNTTLLCHSILINQANIDEIIQKLKMGNNNDNLATQKNQIQKNNLKNTMLQFDIDNIKFPLAVHGFSNKKLAWGKIRMY